MEVVVIVCTRGIFLSCGLCVRECVSEERKIVSICAILRGNPAPNSLKTTGRTFPRVAKAAKHTEKPSTSQENLIFRSDLASSHTRGILPLVEGRCGQLTSNTCAEHGRYIYDPKSSVRSRVMVAAWRRKILRQRMQVSRERKKGKKKKGYGHVPRM
ncbi:hypothetical protein BDV27DRAFT_121183, partial [Aspergillus caelatus]